MNHEIVLKKRRFVRCYGCGADLSGDVSYVELGGERIRDISWDISRIVV